MQETDEFLYRRFLQFQDDGDLRVLFERHRDSLFLFLRGFVRRDEDAEDLMMDTFAVAASGTARFSGKSSFRTWLFAIARNQAGTFLRKASREMTFPAEPRKKAEECTPEYTLLRAEENRELYRAMESLPEDYRQVLYLLYIEQMTRDEACVVMRKSKKQMYNLAERGRAALRDQLKRMGFSNERFG